jgi:hypothetical protein
LRLMESRRVLPTRTAILGMLPLATAHPRRREACEAKRLREVEPGRTRTITFAKPVPEALGLAAPVRG